MIFDGDFIWMFFGFDGLKDGWHDRHAKIKKVLI
jgi:hypothetical protein